MVVGLQPAFSPDAKASGASPEQNAAHVALQPLPCFAVEGVLRVIDGKSHSPYSAACLPVSVSA